MIRLYGTVFRLLIKSFSPHGSYLRSVSNVRCHSRKRRLEFVLRQAASRQRSPTRFSVEAVTNQSDVTDNKIGRKRVSIMRKSFQQCLAAGLVLLGTPVLVTAGDGIVHNFDGWTVTVIPRRSEPAPLVPRQPKLAPSLQSKLTPSLPAKPTSNGKAFTKNGITVRPISFEQTISVAPPDAEPIPTPAPTATPTVNSLPVLNVDSAPQFTPHPVGTIPLPTEQLTTPVTQVQMPTPCEGCDLPVVTPREREPELNPPAIAPQTASYRDIYYSIPFIRSEYDANPSYRHDATMEFIFGQMRPTVINRGTTHVIQHGGGWGGYGYGYGYPGYNGYGYGDPPYYPYSYGLRIHTSR